MNKIIDSASLYYQEGSSDKVYHCTLEEIEVGHVVNFSYGRRGSSLTSGTKTTTPVGLDKAKSIFQKLVREKTSKGYQFNCNKSAPVFINVSANPCAIPPIICNLLNETEDPHEYLCSDDWHMQEKIDGVRFMLQRKGDTLTGYNRRGLAVPIPQFIVEELKDYCFDFILDGELLMEKFYCFDLIQAKDWSLRGSGFQDRYFALNNLFAWDCLNHIRLVPVVTTYVEKKNLMAQIEMAGLEGVVFKKADALYTSGRPASGGNYLKYKFTKTCTCLVDGVNDKRSVSLALLSPTKDGERLVDAGNVTIPVNHAIPEIGSIVEVRYLYAFRESGRLYQPVYLGKRTDLTNDACTTHQLKYKTVVEQEEEAELTTV